MRPCRSNVRRRNFRWCSPPPPSTSVRSPCCTCPSRRRTTSRCTCRQPPTSRGCTCRAIPAGCTRCTPSRMRCCSSIRPRRSRWRNRPRRCTSDRPPSWPHIFRPRNTGPPRRARYQSTHRRRSYRRMSSGRSPPSRPSGTCLCRRMPPPAWQFPRCRRPSDMTARFRDTCTERGSLHHTSPRRASRRPHTRYATVAVFPSPQRTGPSCRPRHTLRKSRYTRSRNRLRRRKTRRRNRQTPNRKLPARSWASRRRRVSRPYRASPLCRASLPCPPGYHCPARRCPLGDRRWSCPNQSPRCPWPEAHRSRHRSPHRQEGVG